MTTVRRFVLAIGVPIALVGATTAPARGAAPPTTPPPATGEFVLPADWTTLVDDTNTISVAVPNTWTDTDTAPDSNPDGTLAPRIGAATDLDIFIETFDAPGVLFRAVPYTGDNQGEMTQSGLTSGCRRKVVQPYDDGAFVGLRGVWSSCGSTGAPQWHQIVASPASHSFTFIVQIQITGDQELAELENVVRSFNFTPEGGAAAGPVLPPTVDAQMAGSEPTSTSIPGSTQPPSSTAGSPTSTSNPAPFPTVSGTVPSNP